MNGSLSSVSWLASSRSWKCAVSRRRRKYLSQSALTSYSSGLLFTGTNVSSLLSTEDSMPETGLCFNKPWHLKVLTFSHYNWCHASTDLSLFFSAWFMFFDAILHLHKCLTSRKPLQPYAETLHVVSAVCASAEYHQALTLISDWNELSIMSRDEIYQEHQI